MKIPRRLATLGRRLPVALYLATLAGLTLAWVVVVAACLLPLPARLAETDAVEIRWDDGGLAHVLLAPDGRWRVAVAPEEVDPRYLKSLIRLEDRRFYAHPGVDPVAIARSALINLRRGEVVTGASTLTMQLVRLLEPRPRTLRSKLVEAFRAAQLELRLSKRGVLRQYLRFLPFGGNVEGIEAAAWSYFGHGADVLAPSEIATLLAVPQGPGSRAPSPAHRQRLTQARDGIAAWLAARAVLAAGPAVPVPERLGPPPQRLAPVAFWLRARHPGQARIDTFLSPAQQAAVEEALARGVDPLLGAGVHNAAAVVVDRATGRVRALAATPDQAEPTPGSALPTFGLRRPLADGLVASPLAVAGGLLGGDVRVTAAWASAGLPAEALPPLSASPDRDAAPGLRRFAHALRGRDAWAGGVGPGQVAVVWAGNLDQHTSAVLTGPVAEPALRAVWDALSAE
ncbi:MAG: transglycosylase domain-containing protein [Myxococcales bacterium]|nr:transglycosylase domain-containing protein [Myxococcales bacterium]